MGTVTRKTQQSAGTGFAADAPVVNIYRAVPRVTLGTATRQTQQYAGTGNLALPHLLSGFSTKGNLLPGFRHTLIGLGTLCDADCAFTFTRKAVIVSEKQGAAVLTGWRDSTGPRLWRISLQPGESNLPSMPKDAKQAALAKYIACDLPRVADLIRYFHVMAGFPVRSTWLKAIGSGKYSSWPGLNLTNATKYCPSTEATIMGNLVQKR